MTEKRKRSDEPDLDLSLKILTDVESVDKIPTLNEAWDFVLKHGQVDPNVDLKKLKRRLSNRLSAQRSRMRGVECKAELEKKVTDLQDTITFVGSEIENVEDNKQKLQLENGMLQEQLNSVTEESNLRIALTEELKLELKKLKELAKAQEEEHMEIEGASFNSYDDDDFESVAEIDIDQYLNLDSMHFSPSKNDM